MDLSLGLRTLAVNATSGWYAPAYTEPMDSILLLATDHTSALPSRFDGYPDTPTAVQAEMAKALHPHVRVRVLVTPGSHEQLRFEAALARAGVPRPLPANISFLPVRHCDIWARDAGPIWLRHRGSGARRMVKPTYTLWGYLVGGPRGRGHVDGPWASCDVPNTVPDQLAPLLGVPVEDASPFKTEGGDKSFNGRGTVLMSLAVERQRHPGLSVAHIEKLARTHLKAAHVVWIDQGVQDDEQSFRGPLRGGANGEQPLYTAIGTGGHVDEAARFVGPRTVVVPQLTAAQAAESRVGAVTAARMDANAKMLEGQTDEAGRPLRVERMPFPEELTLKVNRSDEVFTLLMQLPELKLDADAQIEIVLAASYTNYVVANGVVLVPQYDRPGRPKRFAEADQRARAALGRLFPGRKVVGINAEPVNAGGGGLNCISNNMPA